MKKKIETGLFPATETKVETSPETNTLETKAPATPPEQSKSPEQIRIDGIKELASRYDVLAPSDKLKLRKFIDAELQLVMKTMEKTLSALKAELAGTPPQGELPLTTVIVKGIKTGSNKEKVYNAMKELGNNVSGGNIATKSGVKQPSGILKELVAENRITKSGNGRGTTYSLKA
jgi:hypothetical protein